MNMKRRSFFKLLAGAAVVAASPSLALNLANIPIIWADGVHDDSEGLQALLDGKVVEFAKPELAKQIGWRGDTLYMGAVMFTIKSTIIIGERFSGKTLNGGTYVSDGSAAPIFHVKNTTDAWLGGMTFRDDSKSFIAFDPDKVANDIASISRRSTMSVHSFT